MSEGFEYTYDPDAAEGEHVLQMWLDGERVDLDAEYTIVTNSFLASGGDGFSTFADGANATDTARVDSDIMVGYLAANGSLGTLYDQRAIGVNTESLTVGAGDEPHVRPVLADVHRCARQGGPERRRVPRRHRVGDLPGDQHAAHRPVR
ncbi:hypothetical protein GCM10025876_29380 [Demequina litorisediminis]|uniref:5'-Nucleotidase C-terminal domain-containing protein n=1 Tax=Demequina litorisediminis TaxID=1849022 RepID=A0ABQ6IJ54_9MICO|nr:hypothetical protein GCM10025876_29380 [Demequina litorisediminis]